MTTTDNQRPVDLACDIDGGPMLMRKLEEGAVFDCQQCDQQWIFTRDRTSCTILKTLWPSGMTEDSPMYRDEYLPAVRAEQRFKARARVLAELWSEEEATDYSAKVEAEIAQWYADHPLP